MALRLLLDTNAYTALLRGHADVAARVRAAEGIVLSAVVAGELLFGFRHGSKHAENARRLDAFLENPYVSFLPVTWTTAERFGQIAAGLRRKGRPLPSNDIWIAAHALECGADLLSGDRHFEAIEGLSWIPFS